MRFGKAVEGKGSDLVEDLVLGLSAEPALDHALAQALFEPFHALPGALEAHGPPQFLGLATTEPSHRHRDAQ